MPEPGLETDADQDSSESVFPETSPENPWSPPQFGLGSMLKFTAICAVLFWIVRNFGLQATLPMILLAMFIWLLRRCYDMVMLSEDSKDETDRSE